MKSKIFFFLFSDDGLSTTITNDGLLEDARIKPHEPSSKVNLIPFIVKISDILYNRSYILDIILYIFY